MNDREHMLTSLLKCRKIDLVAGQKELTPAQEAEFGRMVHRRAAGEPLQYIIGQVDFMGTELYVDPRVLIPRPETELLVDHILKTIRTYDADEPLTILDLGAGSGNIAITLIKNNSECSVTAVELDAGAIEVLKKNAMLHKMGDELKIVHQDMMDYIKKALHWGICFDVIVSNPPYIPSPHMHRLPRDVQQEPTVALDGGNDGLKFYKQLIPQVHKLLNLGGYLFFEVGDNQADDLKEIFKKYPQYGDITTHRDYVGTERIITARKVQ